ncbi:hypothetical protein HII31_04123 [Pseudocercospora fuligena]|uniref:Uncharacterized protein n=1 Tax=Pseudocercospora fuligena TaxID=685502 RepID=A0A8H6RPU4_9PEZI|nr:hypothetical protein HII31_04123 [Pseudocercospora fuligena]
MFCGHYSSQSLFDQVPVGITSFPSSPDMSGAFQELAELCNETCNLPATAIPSFGPYEGKNIGQNASCLD